MTATSKPTLWLLVLALTGCGKLADDLFCESEGCDWKAGEWARVAALANPGPPPPDPSNEYLGDSAAELLGQAFFFDKAFSGLPTEVDAINRPSPPARTPKCQPLAISCATCHDLARAGVDTTSVPGHVSVGAGWTDVNALAVVNSAYRPVVFWNGRADSLWALNVVVAESATTLNGNRLRTAHQIADTLCAVLRCRVREATLGPSTSRRSPRCPRTASRARPDGDYDKICGHDRRAQFGLRSEEQSASDGDGDADPGELVEGDRRLRIQVDHPQLRLRQVRGGGSRLGPDIGGGQARRAPVRRQGRRASTVTSARSSPTISSTTSAFRRPASPSHC